MPAAQPVSAIKLRKPRGWSFRNEIRSYRVGIIAKGAPDNLNDLSISEVYAWSKHHGRLEFRLHCSKFQVIGRGSLLTIQAGVIGNIC
jgi:hypothetical protein